MPTCKSEKAHSRSMCDFAANLELLAGSIHKVCVMVEDVAVMLG